MMVKYLLRRGLLVKGARGRERSAARKFNLVDSNIHTAEPATIS